MWLPREELGRGCFSLHCPGRAGTGVAGTMPCSVSPHRPGQEVPGAMTRAESTPCAACSLQWGGIGAACGPGDEALASLITAPQASCCVLGELSTGHRGPVPSPCPSPSPFALSPSPLPCSPPFPFHSPHPSRGHPAKPPPPPSPLLPPMTPCFLPDGVSPAVGQPQGVPVPPPEFGPPPYEPPQPGFVPPHMPTDGSGPYVPPGECHEELRW